MSENCAGGGRRAEHSTHAIRHGEHALQPKHVGRQAQLPRDTSAGRTCGKRASGACWAPADTRIRCTSYAACTDGRSPDRTSSVSLMMMIFIGTKFCNLHRDANGLHLRQTSVRPTLRKNKIHCILSRPLPLLFVALLLNPNKRYI